MFSSKIHIDLFVDDTNIYFSYTIESERYLLQNNLNLFSQWANQYLAIKYFFIKMRSYDFREGYSI